VAPAQKRKPISPTHAALGRVIEEGRLNSGLTQDQFADRVLVNLKRFGELERGVRDAQLGELIRLCSALEVNLVGLMTRVEDALVELSGGS
jgi:transcriptional regulator with XRE-family HTH domain